MRHKKHPAQIRREAAAMARVWARGREDCGDPEGAGEFRDLASQIERIRLTEDR